MEVILKQDVDKVGKASQVVKVKDGFARNFLIPNGLAVPLNPANLKKLEQEKQRKTEELEKARKEAEAIKVKLAGFSLTLPVLTHEEDKLYASVGALDIARLLKEEGFDIDKGAVALAEPIKSLGIYEIPVNLHSEVSTTIKLWIVKK